MLVALILLFYCLIWLFRIFFLFFFNDVCLPSQRHSNVTMELVANLHVRLVPPYQSYSLLLPLDILISSHVQFDVIHVQGMANGNSTLELITMFIFCDYLVDRIWNSAKQ